MKYKIGEDTFDLDRITVHEGVPVSLIPVISGTHLNADGLSWYATKLPEGLAMTKWGVITGVPVKHIYEPYESYVYVEDRCGYSFKYTLKIGVYEQDLDLSFYLCNGTFTASTDFSSLVHEPSNL